MCEFEIRTLRRALHVKLLPSPTVIAFVRLTEQLAFPTPCSAELLDASIPRAVPFLPPELLDASLVHEAANAII